MSKLLGHTDLKTTMIYAKVAVETMQQAVEKLQLLADGKTKILDGKKLLPEKGTT